MMGTIKSRAAVIKKPSEMGRVTKIEKSPWDIISDRRRDVSSFCPRTRARIIGAPSYRNFFIRNPRIPKMSMMMTSATAVFQAIGPNQTKKQDQRIEEIIRDLENLHPHGDEWKVKNKKHSVPDIHAHDGPPEQIRSILSSGEVRAAIRGSLRLLREWPSRDWPVSRG